jgi:hypothetical protein
MPHVRRSFGKKGFDQGALVAADEAVGKDAVQFIQAEPPEEKLENVKLGIAACPS